MKIQLIPLHSIQEDPEQPRKHHNEESLKGLADSIRQHGMLNPITVIPVDGSDRYRIITGERRWRAASMANLDNIPCVVRDRAPDDRLTEQLIENLQREDLQPVEKARALLQIKTTLNLTNREVAKRLGLSERTIGYLLDLLALPEEIGEAVVSSPSRKAEGQITEKHARFLKQLNEEPELQSAVVERIKGEHLNSEDTGKLVKALKKQPGKSKEILDSPADHLTKFFLDAGDPLDAAVATLEVEEAPSRLSTVAQKLLDFLPTLSSIDPGRYSHPELRQIEDALTSLKLAVDGTLKAVKEQLN